MVGAIVSDWRKRELAALSRFHLRETIAPAMLFGCREKWILQHSRVFAGSR